MWNVYNTLKFSEGYQQCRCDGNNTNRQYTQYHKQICAHVRYLPLVLLRRISFCVMYFVYTMTVLYCYIHLDVRVNECLCQYATQQEHEISVHNNERE